MTEITTSGLKSVCCDPCVCENKLAIDLQGLESVFVAYRLQKHCCILRTGKSQATLVCLISSDCYDKEVQHIYYFTQTRVFRLLPYLLF